MTKFMRLLANEDKSTALKEVCGSLRLNSSDDRIFNIDPASFSTIPGTPFAYWVSQDVRDVFRQFPPFESEGRAVRQGLATADDFRFVRAWWEVRANNEKWPGFAKGGKFSPFYADVFLVVNWGKDGEEIKNNLNEKGNIRSNVWMLADTAANYFRKPGLTWPSRARKFAPQALASNCLFSQRGYLAFFPKKDQIVSLAMFNSTAFDYLFKTTLGRFGYPEFLVGILKRMPIAKPAESDADRFESLARLAWSIKRRLDTVEETSHAFHLPGMLRDRIGDYDPPSLEAELVEIQAKIDEIAFDLYGFSDADRAAALELPGYHEAGVSDEDEDRDSSISIDQVDALLSWATGVCFGRFDLRLANGEREPPPEPDPFDPLPAKSPGMLPDGEKAFHAHIGILVDDQGHKHDLPRLIDDVLTHIQVAVSTDLRLWLFKDFFPHHLKHYSKSRRKAPLYWPLSTASGDYTLWIYYPMLTSQTLYTAVNDFVDPKLKDVAAELTRLRQKGADRSSADEEHFAGLSDFEAELQELRTKLLETAERYLPNQDDGVQITAAPLWPLFRHKPWQKLLKETWEELEEGKYDWAHLAMAYWPHRVVRTAHTDRSIAIAHDLEDELWHEVDLQDKRGKTKTEWQPRDLSESALDRIAERFK